MIYIYMYIYIYIFIAMEHVYPTKNNKCPPKAGSQIFFHSYVSLSKGRDSMRVYTILCS